MIELTELPEEVVHETVEMLSAVNKKRPEANQILSQGIIGEQIVLSILQQTTGKVNKTENWYDQEKDGTVNGETYEVKTIFPWWSEYGMPLPVKQLRKVTEVDIVFFVQVPASNEHEIKVWELPKQNRKSYKSLTTRTGRIVALYEFTSLVPYGIVKNEAIARDLRSFNPTAKSYVR